MEATRGFVRFSQENDITGVTLADLLGHLDAILSLGFRKHRQSLIPDNRFDVTAFINLVAGLDTNGLTVRHFRQVPLCKTLQREKFRFFLIEELIPSNYRSSGRLSVLPIRTLVGFSIEVVVNASEFGSVLSTGGSQMDMRSEWAFPAAVLNTVRYPLILVDREGRIEAASHAAASLLTVLPEAVQGRSIGDVAGSQGLLLHDAVASVITSGRSRPTEIRSDSRTFDIVVEPILAEAGEVTGAAIHATERLTSSLEVADGSAASDPLWLVLNQLPHAVYWKDRHSRYLGGNRIFAEVVGLESYDVVPGITDYDIMAPSDAEAVRREDEQVLLTGECLATIEQSLKLATGETIIEKLKMPLRSEGGEIIGILCIARDITEQKRAEERLVAGKLAAEQANREKTSFLAAASHDLRQPIQALALFAKLLDNRVTEPASKNLVRLIQQSVRSLADLLEAVIHLSKLDAGVVAPNIGPMPLDNLLRRLCEEFTPQAAEKGLDLIVVNTAMEVCSDPLLLERILRNLISNAIRYTERGRVLIGCRRRGATVSIEVWDTGIGIPPDQFGEIFREFHRSHKKTHTAIEGFGIGLAVVDRLTSLLGHHIAVSSTPGKGTVFRIEGLPSREPRTGPQHGLAGLRRTHGSRS